MTKKISLYIGILLLVTLVQEFGLSRLTLFNVSPDIVTIFIAFISVTIGQKTGTSFGFAAGLLSGILSGNIGLHMLAGATEGFTAGYFNIPENSHATAKLKTKRLYGAVVTAGFCTNAILAVGYNPLGLSVPYRIFVLGILESLMTLLLAFIITRFFLRKSLAD
ncbi:MAG: rod shape-determining protein MreD [Chlorobium sp.]|nr:MAG: rod shape-determining protein MreD [Chlorobium sp.]